MNTRRIQVVRSGEFAKGLDPRCCRQPFKGKIPETLNATCLLKPCCYYSTTSEWNVLVAWANENGCDAASDLSAKDKTIDQVKESPTWLLFQEGYKNGNVPTTCYEKCSDDQEYLGTKEANNWKKVEE